MSFFRSVAKRERKNYLLFLPEADIFICDFEKQDQISDLAFQVGESFGNIDGILHSIAFANYSEGMKPFHETNRKDYLQATQISSFSLVELANSFKELLSKMLRSSQLVYHLRM